MPTASLDPQGRITIPKEVRDSLGLRTGSHVEFVTGRNGRMILKPVTSDFRSLRGMLKSPLKRPMTLKEMDDAIMRGACGLP